MGQNSFIISAFLAAGLTIFSSYPFTRPGNNLLPTPTATKVVGDHSPVITDPRTLFTLPDAEKILGEPAHLADSGATAPGVARASSPDDSVLHIKKQASSWRCAYEANVVDEKTGRKGIVYFLIEDYPQVSLATTVYSFYKRSNETHPGFKEVQGPGWESWSGDSPVSVYMRKANKIMVMKVNKMTSKTSTDGFNEVVKNIAGKF